MINAKVSGRYKLSVVRDGEIINSIASGNLVTDFGLNHLVSTPFVRSFLNTNLFVGTGSTPPSPSDTSLDNQLASTSSRIIGNTELIYDEVNAPNDFGFRVPVVFNFTLGSVVGNITELGAGSSGNQLRTRSLITDENGDPVAITVTADDQLIVEYEISLTGLPVQLPPQDFVLDGVTHSVIMEICGSGSLSSNTFDLSQMIGVSPTFNQMWGVNDSAVPGRQTWPNATIANTGFARVSPSLLAPTGTYPPFTMARKHRIPVGNGNPDDFPDGIRYMVLADESRFVDEAPITFYFDPPLVKNSTQIFEYEYFVTFGRG